MNSYIIKELVNHAMLRVKLLYFSLFHSLLAIEFCLLIGQKKSRLLFSFTSHFLNIKLWLFRQLADASMPLMELYAKCFLPTR
jgi:hypothetical protein